MSDNGLRRKLARLRKRVRRDQTANAFLAQRLQQAHDQTDLALAQREDAVRRCNAALTEKQALLAENGKLRQRNAELYCRQERAAEVNLDLAERVARARVRAFEAQARQAAAENCLRQERAENERLRARLDGVIFPPF